MARRPGSRHSAMFAYHDAGFTTFDLADHYGPAEDFIGDFRRLNSQPTATQRSPTCRPLRSGSRSLGSMPARRRRRYLPSRAPHGHASVSTCFNSIGGITATGVSRRAAPPRRLRGEGQIRHVALTNFDTERLRTIVEHGVHIVSNQIQFSLIDLRPDRMIPYCREHGITLLTYGTVCGGLLSERYLGQAEPRASSSTRPACASTSR